MIRTGVLCLLVLTIASAYAAPASGNGRISLLQVLEAIDAASSSRSAQAMLGTYFKAAIEGAVAAGKQSGSPVICAKPGRGKFDAKEFAAFALKRKPTKASQARAAATPILINFVRRQNPCG